MAQVYPRMTVVSVQYLVVLLTERVVVFVRKALFYKRYGKGVWRGSIMRNVLLEPLGAQRVEGKLFGLALEKVLTSPFSIINYCWPVHRFIGSGSLRFEVRIRATTTGNTGSCKSLHEKLIFLNVFSFNEYFNALRPFVNLVYIVEG